MKKYTFPYFIVFLMAWSLQSYGQNCDDNYQQAKRHFETGGLHLVFDLLDDCLKNKNYGKLQTIEGFRLLANAAFMLDSVNLGKQYLAEILNRDLDFESTNSDVFKLRESLTKLRKSPNLQFGVDFGINYSQLAIIDIYDEFLNRENAAALIGLTNGSLLTDITEQLGPTVKLVVSKKLLSMLEVESGLGYQLSGFHYYDQFNGVSKAAQIHDFLLPVLINYRIPVELSKNTIQVQAGINFSWLYQWDHSKRLGEPFETDLTGIRTPLNYSAVIGASLNLKVGNLIMRPNFQYNFGLTPRSKTISGSENASYAYNSPSYVNYNSRLSHFNLSIGLLKQRF